MEKLQCTHCVDPERSGYKMANLRYPRSKSCHYPYHHWKPRPYPYHHWKPRPYPPPTRSPRRFSDYRPIGLFFRSTSRICYCARPDRFSYRRSYRGSFHHRSCQTIQEERRNINFIFWRYNIWVGRRHTEIEKLKYDECPNCDGRPGFIGAPLLYDGDTNKDRNTLYGIAYGDLRDLPMDLGPAKTSNDKCNYMGSSHDAAMEYPFVPFNAHWQQTKLAMCAAEAFMNGDPEGKRCPGIDKYYNGNTAVRSLDGDDLKTGRR
jgi:hypothetical protein